MATTSFTVLVKGESGSGKELVARAIHQRSSRADGPFVAVNCAALVETLLEAELFGIEDRTATGVRGRPGKFELANGGTLLLDEVADLTLPAQAKLLRAIQEMAVERVGGHVTRTLDTRLLVATNRCLSDMVTAERFRADLYYRLSGLEIRVPPLRERRSDILLLADHFAQRHPGSRDLHLSPAAVDAMMTYDWPGNVRELQRVIERAVTLSATGRIAPEDLPSRVTGEYAERLLPSLVRDDTMRAWGSRYGWCSTAATTTSGKPVGCSGSATTRCRPTCGTRARRPVAGRESARDPRTPGRGRALPRNTWHAQGTRRSAALPRRVRPP